MSKERTSFGSHGGSPEGDWSGSRTVVIDSHYRSGSLLRELSILEGR